MKVVNPISMSKVGRELPHDLLAEKSLLGCLLIDGHGFGEISDLGLRKEDFFNVKNGVVFEAVKDLFLTNSPIDYISVCSKLNDWGKLVELGGQEHLLALGEEQGHSANIAYYAKVVKDKSSIRNIIRTAMGVADAGINYVGNTEEFIADVEGKFFKLTNEAKNAGLTKLVSCLKENLKALEDAARGPGEIAGLPTGFPALDNLLLGMQPGQLIVLAARPAMGKTSLALNVAVNCSELTKLPVAIFSLEMMSSELSMRILSSKAKVDSKRMKTKNFFDTDLRSIGMAVQQLSTLPIFINDSASVSVLDIQGQCRKIKAEQGLGLVLIDYLQLMKSHSSNNNLQREQQISEISRSLKNMAKELQCPVIALSQLNRSVEARPNKRPNLSDLRESGAIEQDADIVLMIYRDEVYNPDSKEPGIAELILVKNRHGESGTAKVAWIGAYTSFENLSLRGGPHGD